MFLQPAIDKRGKQKVERGKGPFRPADAYIALARDDGVEDHAGDGLRVVFGGFCAVVQYRGEPVICASAHRARCDVGDGDTRAV